MDFAKTVEITLDKTRTMRFSMYAFARAEQAINDWRKLDPRRSIFAIVDEELNGIKELEISADLTMIMLWASLLHEEKTLTIEQVGETITDFRQAFAKLLTLIEATFRGPSNDETELSEEAQKKSSERQNGKASLPLPESN